LIKIIIRNQIMNDTRWEEIHKYKYLDAKLICIPKGYTMDFLKSPLERIFFKKDMG